MSERFRWIGNQRLKLGFLIFWELLFFINLRCFFFLSNSFIHSFRKLHHFIFAWNWLFSCFDILEVSNSILALDISILHILIALCEIKIIDCCLKLSNLLFLIIFRRLKFFLRHEILRIQFFDICAFLIVKIRVLEIWSNDGIWNLLSKYHFRKPSILHYFILLFQTKLETWSDCLKRFWFDTHACVWNSLLAAALFIFDPSLVWLVLRLVHNLSSHFDNFLYMSFINWNVFIVTFAHNVFRKTLAFIVWTDWFLWLKHNFQIFFLWFLNLILIKLFSP